MARLLYHALLEDAIVLASFLRFLFPSKYCILLALFAIRAAVFIILAA